MVYHPRNTVLVFAKIILSLVLLYQKCYYHENVKMTITKKQEKEHHFLPNPNEVLKTCHKTIIMISSKCTIK